MSRWWLITSTMYGTWLPGDERGFVSRVEAGDGPRVIHNAFGDPYDRDIPSLRRSAELLMKGAPIYLTEPQACAVLEQFHETARFRGWQIVAAAIMANHFHLVVEVPGDVDSAHILRDFKSYASRRLNRRWRTPASGTWWTESGSRRPLPVIEAVRNAVRYTRDQPNALAVYVEPEWLRILIVEDRTTPERGASAP